MTKNDYAEAMMDKVEEFLEEMDISEGYELSVANVTVNRQTVMIIEFPDENDRAYLLPHRDELINAAESLDDLNTEPFLSTIRQDILDYEGSKDYSAEVDEDVEEEDYDEDPADWYDEEVDESYDEDEEYNEDGEYHNKEYYKDYDTNYIDEFTETAKEWIHDYNIHNPEKIIDVTAIDFAKLNDIYQNNTSSFHKTMKKEISKLTRDYSEAYYEDFDTDSCEEFEEAARMYIKDNRNNFLDDVDYTEVLECVDYETLNEEYQSNDLSFRDTMRNYLNDLCGLKDMDRVEEEHDNESHEEQEEIVKPVTFSLLPFGTDYNSLRDLEEKMAPNLLSRRIYTTMELTAVNSIGADVSKEDVKKAIMADTAIKKTDDNIFEITSKEWGDVTGSLLYMDEILKKIKEVACPNNSNFYIGAPHTGKILVSIENSLPFMKKVSDEFDDIYNDRKMDNDFVCISDEIYSVGLNTEMVYAIENISQDIDEEETEEEEQSWNVEF